MSGAIVESQAVAMGGKAPNKKKYVVCYAKKMFAIPQEDVKLLPQKVNKIGSPEELGALLPCKAPEKWKKYCQHGYVGHLKGDEGTAPYTTFEVEGYEDEWRFLRPISKVVADKIFPEILKKVLADPDIPEPTNERQQARIDIYRWTSAKELPDKNQLSPEVNKWPEITASEETIRSCSIAPIQQKRKKGSSDKGDREDEESVKVRIVSKREQTKVEVGPKGSYSIVEEPGFVRVISHEVQAADAPAENNEQDI